MEKLILESAVLVLPLVVLFFHIKLPGNKITPYLIPKNLADRKYPKVELRRAGAGCYALAIWCFSVVYVTVLFFWKSVEHARLLLPLLFFVLPIVMLMSLVIGTIYLTRGIFGRGEAADGLESFGEGSKEQLPRYILKLKFYNVVNMLALLMLVVLIPLEAAMGTGTRGWPVLLNVSLLITFILTLWRIRFYLVRAVVLLDLSSNKVLASTLGSPIGVLFVWFHSILILRKFRESSGRCG